MLLSKNISLTFIFNNIQQEVLYFYKQEMNCFFIFLKLFQKYDIIKSVKGNKKMNIFGVEVFQCGVSIEVIKKYIQGQGGKNEDS